MALAKAAQKDAKKLSEAGLRGKAEELLTILSEDPFRSPPPFENWLESWPGFIRAESIDSIVSYTASIEPLER